MDFLNNLFSSNRFMPHGFCYLWNSPLIWLHFFSDSLIALAYFSIPVTLLYFVSKRRDLPFHGIFVCFGAFIFACGAIHVMELWTLWHANYWLSGTVKALTAAVSVPTAIWLMLIVPQALSLPSPEDLRHEIVARKRVQEALATAKMELELRVENRTADLMKANETLVAEIAQRAETEDRLRRSEEQFRLVVERVRDYAIFSLDPDGFIASWNVGAESIKGYKVEEIIGQHFSRFYPREEIDRDKPVLELREAEAKGWAHDQGWRLHKDGSRFWADVVITALRNGRGELIGFSNVTHDLTERKRAEQALQEANAELAHMARVTTIGELTASIAHEINQPLSAIVNNANACRRILSSESPDLEEARECVADIAESGSRAGAVITRVRALVKRALPIRAQININDVIREVLALAGGEMEKYGIAARTELNADLPPVLGDRIQLQQVILNLIMNGAEAMTSIADRPRILRIRSLMQESGTVSVSVQDSGAGLDPGSLAHVFDAFFTTKPTGMGMGLPISRSIVEAHGGRLWLTSDQNQGATSQFTLPAAA